MNFVFYDTETTGVSTDFDQILQFAAILTDPDLNEIDRFEMRCRLLPHVLPHPGALKVTGMSITAITDAALPCHYSMMRAVRSKLLQWSPATFIGYNSMDFDEHLLRQALFKTLHGPYLTNTEGNGRADAMKLVQAASQFAPSCLAVPNGTKGSPIFKLDQLAPANGFDHSNAHDALADVQATIHLARCVKANAPVCWARFVRLSSKSGVKDMLMAEPAVVLTEFYFGRPYHFVVVPIGSDPDNRNVQLCLDVKNDLDSIASLSGASLKQWATQRPKPVRKVKTNAAPSIAPIGAVPPAFLRGLSLAEIAVAASRVRKDRALRERLIEAVVSSREETVPSSHVEEQLYSDFIPDTDRARMDAFHCAPWPDRAEIVNQFADARLRYHGSRLIYERHPETLSDEARAFFFTLDRDRLMDTSGSAKWGTLSAAIAAISELRPGCDSATRQMLDGYETFLLARMQSLKESDPTFSP